MPDHEADEILSAKLKPKEREQLLETARLLEQEKPVPRPMFRGKLAKELRANPPERRRVRMLIGAYAGSGLTLWMIVVLGLVGLGPVAT